MSRAANLAVVNFVLLLALVAAVAVNLMLTLDARALSQQAWDRTCALRRDVNRLQREEDSAEAPPDEPDGPRPRESCF